MTSVIQQTAKTEFVTGAGDVKYAYRRFGAANSANPPLLMLPHFRATMDTWDPIIVNTLARDRSIILLDFPGVGRSTGSVASSFSKTADQVIDFLSLIKETQIDLFGFSIGGCIAQMVTLNGRPGLVRKLVIASNGPSVGVETVGRDLLEDEMAAASTATLTVDSFLVLFFPRESGRAIAAAKRWWRRIYERSESTSGEQRSDWLSANYADGGVGLQIQSGAVGAWWTLENAAEGSYDRLSEIKIPVMVSGGHEDVFFPPINSFVLQQKLPNAQLHLYPDSGHGFLFQYPDQFSKDVIVFLDD